MFLLDKSVPLNQKTHWYFLNINLYWFFDVSYSADQLRSYSKESLVISKDEVRALGRQLKLKTKHWGAEYVAKLSGQESQKRMEQVQ